MLTRRLMQLALVAAMLVAPVTLRAAMTSADCQRFYAADAYNANQRLQVCLGSSGGPFSYGGAMCYMEYSAMMASANAVYVGCMAGI